MCQSLNRVPEYDAIVLFVQLFGNVSVCGGVFVGERVFT